MDSTGLDIISKLAKLDPRKQVCLQWIPSHVGVPVNEAAEELAEAMGASAVESTKVCILYVCNRIEEWINFFTSHDQFFGTYIMSQQLIQMTKNFEGIALSMFDLAVEFDSINSSRRSSASAAAVV
ncbi:hypothetical protein TNCV_528891 [Trichonephila clavipes]|nr:hypothetical protein TNCV_528891 [Trichonephila clavipes]